MELPQRQLEQSVATQEVAVIGSGIAGCLAAYALASEGFSVSVIEERATAFSGTSARAIQAHLGGLYSGSPETARECLRSAIELKKAMPFSLNDKEAQFLVADESEATLEEYVEFYQGLADYYGGLPMQDQVFGPAEDFFRVLKSEEFDFAKNVEGGIATKEPGLDMLRTRSTLLRKLGQFSVRIETSTQVRSVRRQAGRFVLDTVRGEVQEDAVFDQVINAGGYKARLLDNELGDQTQYNLYLKTWNLVRNADGRAPLPPFYVVRGDFVHHSPFGNDGLVSLITATNEGSYLGTMQYGKENPQLPPEWIDILSSGDIPGKTQRQRTIVEYACDEFLRDSHFTPVDLVPGVAVSFSASRQDRTRRGANQVVPGWQTIVPTKATNALELAQEARGNALRYSTNQEEVSASSA